MLLAGECQLGSRDNLMLVCRLPSILESTFRPAVSGGPGLQLYITCYNTIFLFILVAVVYGMVRLPCHTVALSHCLLPCTCPLAPRNHVPQVLMQLREAL